VRTAAVDVQDVSTLRDNSQLAVTVTSPRFENLATFKRRDLVNGSLDLLRREPTFTAKIVTLHLVAPSETEQQQGQSQP
jgi:stress-induced morphogen